MKKCARGFGLLLALVLMVAQTAGAVEAGGYRVSVEKGTSLLESAEVFFRDTLESFSKLWVEAGQRVEGMLWDETGKPLADTRVVFRTDPFHETVTDKEGKISLMLPANREYEMLYERDGELVSIGRFTPGQGGALDVAGLQTVITLHDADLQPVPDAQDAYLVGHALEALSGDVLGDGRAVSVTLKMACESLTLMETKALCQGGWSLVLPPLLEGKNTLTVTVEEESGRVTERAFVFYNLCEENAARATLDERDGDRDGLPNWKETLLGTNPDAVDTDGDGLTDYEEAYITCTDPTLPDTDGNGVPDGEEDFDADGLSNRLEIRLNGDPFQADTDLDGLHDLAEYEAGTRLDVADSDGDGLSDHAEILLGTYPLNPDSNYNGVLDGEELFEAVVAFAPDPETGGMGVSLRLTAPGREIGAVRIAAASPEDEYLRLDIPGYLQAGFDIVAPEDFDDARLSFVLDEALMARVKSGEVTPAIYQRDSRQRLVELPGQVRVGNVLSAKIDGPGQVIVLDKQAHLEAWARVIPSTGSETALVPALDVGLVIDLSVSMRDNDPENRRFDAAMKIVSRLTDRDRVAVVGFFEDAKLLAGFTGNRKLIENAVRHEHLYGGTAIYRGIEAALFAFEETSLVESQRVMVVLSDGDDNYLYDYDPLAERATALGVTIHTVGLGEDVNTRVLEGCIAEPTGGQYFPVENAEALAQLFETLFEEEINPDRDGDGLWDAYEADGLRLGNGVTLYTDPENPDTDGDGLLDGEEVEMVLTQDGAEVAYFFLKSNPLLPDMETGGDMTGEAGQPHCRGCMPTHSRDGGK